MQFEDANLRMLKLPRNSTSVKFHGLNNSPVTLILLLVDLLFNLSDEELTLKNVSLLTLYGGQFTFSTQLITLNYPVILSH